MSYYYPHINDLIREQDPLKQGLKLLEVSQGGGSLMKIREQDPLKQGLKLLLTQGSIIF